MSDGKKIVGLDIGTTKIAAVVGRLDADGKMVILEHNEIPSRGVSRGVVQNIANTTDDITKVFQNIGEQIDIKDVVVVGIAGGQVKNYHSTEILAFEKETMITSLHISKLRKKASGLALRSGEKSIRTIPQSYYIDGVFAKNPVGRGARRIEARFLSVIFKENPIRNIEQCVSKAGLKVKNVFLNSWASALATLNEEEREKGVALVDIGGGTTDLAIFQDKKIRHTAVIKFGGNNITEKIQNDFRTSRKNAEKLKIKKGFAWLPAAEKEIVKSLETKFGFPLPQNIENNPKKDQNIQIGQQKFSLRELATAIQSEMKDCIVNPIEREINTYLKSPDNHFGNDLSLVLTGGGSKIEGLETLVKDVTRLSDVRIGRPRKEIFGENEALNCPSLAAAVGLSMRASSFLDPNDAQKLEGQHKDSPVEEVEKPAENDSTKPKKSFLAKLSPNNWFPKFSNKAKELD